MIPYVEIHDKYTRLPFAMIEPAECWFEIAFHGVGEFEIYTPVTKNAISCLKCGNYVTLPQKSFVWLIESVSFQYDANGKRHMISAKGRQAKIILKKRIIKAETILPTSLTDAIFLLIRKNAGENAGALRRINEITQLASTVLKDITEAQVSYANLYDYTEELLAAYDVGAELTIKDDASFKYTLYEGADRTESIIFSQTFENLISSEYEVNIASSRTYALVGGQGEGTERILQECDNAPTMRGIDREEMFVDAKDVSNKYIDANGEEKELDLTDAAQLATYKDWLSVRGETELSKNKIQETFIGEIEANLQGYAFGVDYNLGDRVRVADDYLGVYITPRVLKVTMRQDRNYAEILEYGG